MTKIISLNPSTGEVLGEVESTSKEEISVKVNKARAALKGWKDLGVQGRVKVLRKVVEGFEKRKDGGKIIFQKHIQIHTSNKSQLH